MCRFERIFSDRRCFEAMSILTPLLPQGLEVMFLSDFRPREEYYVLLNDDSSTILKDLEKMLKSSIRICYFYESVFIFFIFHYFAIFWDIL